MRILFIAFAIGIFPPLAGAVEPWQLQKIYQTEQLTSNRFYLSASADLDGNRRPEIIVADFGQVGELYPGYRQEPRLFNLFLLEWDSQPQALKLKWRKQWDGSVFDATRGIYPNTDFVGWNAERIIPFPVDKRVFVETVPPYIGLEWKDNKYELREQREAKYDQPNNNIGSWVFPFINRDCYPASYLRDMPALETECLLAIRDLRGDGKSRIVTLYVDRGRIIQERKGYGSPRGWRYDDQPVRKIALRIRKWEPGFPVEWQLQIPYRLSAKYQDRYNWRLTGGLVVMAYGNTLEMEALEKKGVIEKTGRWPYFFLEPEPAGKGYRLRPFSVELVMDSLGARGYGDPIGGHWYPDVHTGFTRSKVTREMWGYARMPAYDGKYIPALRRVVVRPDLKGYESFDLRFSHHEPFLGVGHFELTDFDGDGLDEVILMEETGRRRQSEHGELVYTEIKDYIHILKWNGKEYETLWISPPYTIRGTKFLVDDIKGDGKKQLVVFNAYGSIEVWERK